MKLLILLLTLISVTNANMLDLFQHNYEKVVFDFHPVDKLCLELLEYRESSLFNITSYFYWINICNFLQINGESKNIKSPDGNNYILTSLDLLYEWHTDFKGTKFVKGGIHNDKVLFAYKTDLYSVPTIVIRLNTTEELYVGMDDNFQYYTSTEPIKEDIIDYIHATFKLHYGDSVKMYSDKDKNLALHSTICMSPFVQTNDPTPARIFDLNNIKLLFDNHIVLPNGVDKITLKIEVDDEGQCPLKYIHYV